MRAWVLAALRADARAWWHHRELREAGWVAEAARLERGSIRQDLDVIRKTLATPGAHVSIGRGGTTIHFARGATLSGCGDLAGMATARVLVAMGLTRIDTTTAPDPWRVVALPLGAVGEAPDPPPWHGLSGVPLAVYAARARVLGATVRNLPPEAQCGAADRRGG